MRIPNEGGDERAQHLSVRKLEGKLTREMDLGRKPENLPLKFTETVGDKRRGADGSRRGVTARVSRVAILSTCRFFKLRETAGLLRIKVLNFVKLKTTNDLNDGIDEM